MTKNQLLAGAEFQNKNTEEISVGSDEEEPVTVVVAAKKRQKKSDIVWKIGEPQPTASALFPQEDYRNYENLNPIDLFELFVDDNIIKHILQ